jgi:hypothetical protein
VQRTSSALRFGGGATEWAGRRGQTVAAVVRTRRCRAWKAEERRWCGGWLQWSVAWSGVPFIGSEDGRGGSAVRGTAGSGVRH